MSTSKKQKRLIIQSVLFDRKKYTLDESFKILGEFRFRPIGEPIITKNVIWFTIIDKSKFVVKSLEKFNHPKLPGIQFNMGKLDTKKLKAKRKKVSKKLRKKLNPGETL